MTEDPFPHDGRDGAAPEGSGLPPAPGNGPAGEEDMPAGEAGQGLFVCLPAEELTLAGFGQGGRADTMPPGPLMAAVVDAVAGEDGAGLKGLSDDQLIGVISAARRLEARAAWTQLAALAEFAARGLVNGKADAGGLGDRTHLYHHPHELRGLSR
jgi:hypothetical protein